MKKTLITAAILAASCAAPAAFADTDTGTLTINGVIEGTTCHFVSGAQTAQINMHKIGTDSLKDLTPGQAYDGYENKTSTSFQIQCPEGVDAPKLKFLGEQFAVTGDENVTVNSNEATKSVGYALLINNHRIDTNGSTPIADAPSADGKYTFDIAARYARATTDEVVGGDVNSVVTFTVVAD